jgi:periplasmic protein TonB
MNRQRKSFALSLVIHGVLLGSIYAVSSTCAQNDAPIVIDFNVVGGAGSGLGPANLPAGPPAPGAAGHPRSTPPPAHAVARSETLKASLPVAETVAKTAVEQTGPAAIIESSKTGAFVAAKNESSGTPSVAGKPGGPSGAGGSGHAGGGGGGSGTSPGGGGTGGSGGFPGGGMSADQLRNRYLKEHFAYIKDLIQRNISYPQRARKMGWSGRVVISFIVHETGRVSNEKVVSSSGFELLDNNVITTIRAVAPFPPPPVKAELSVPIVYRLE